MVNVKGQMSESGVKRFRADSPSAIPHFTFHIRRGMTLIELLVAISIIATLSALFLGASRAAMEHSRAARTRTTIDKLHTLLMERWADYETRRVALKGTIENDINTMVAVTPDQQRAKAAARHDYQLLASRELMRLEMPDRWSNITGVSGRGANVTTAVPPLLDNDPNLLMVLRELPTLTKIYRRRYDYTRTTEEYESAECLYMIIMYGCGDGEARTMFSAQDMGDVDGDGAPEFLDGWGEPINFIRWPAGFVSQSAVMTWDAERQMGDAANDHDPFDYARRDMSRDSGNPSSQPSTVAGFLNDAQGAFRLVPLIFSSGPDGERGVLNPGDGYVNALPGAGSDAYPFARLDPYAAIFSDPEYQITNAMQATVGGGDGRLSTHLDNIHNHQDTTR